MAKREDDMIAPKHKRVTLAQVAQRAGVSRSAASFVLSGRTDQRISQEVWARVEKAAEELGYRPNAMARALSTGVSNSLLLISDYIATTSTANSMIAGVLDAAIAAGKSVLLIETRGDKEAEKKLVSDMLDRQIDAVIYASMFTRGVEIPQQLKTVPTVLLNCWTDIHRWPSLVGSVVPDETKAGAQIAQLALNHGFSGELYFVGDVEKSPFNNWMPLAYAKRLEGIETVLREHKHHTSHMISVHDWTVSAGYEALKDVFKQGVRLQAESESRPVFICANDQLAFGAYRAAREAGLQIGNDIGIASFDNTEVAGWIEPGLTSVTLPYYDMGKSATQILVKSLENHSQQGTSFEKVSIPMEIVERASL